MKFDKETMPKHIAIIMDGNRRWARAKGKPVSFGHKEGAKTLEKIIKEIIFNNVRSIEFPRAVIVGAQPRIG